MFFNKKEESNEIEHKIINDIRALTVDIINSKKRGNYELSLNLIPTLYTLYGKHLKINTNDDKWINRDRVVLSLYTALPALISTLYTSGYNISINQLKAENKLLNDISGLDVIIDNYNEALSIATGMSFGEKYLNDLFKKQNIFDFYTYLICTDIDFIDGNNFEALSFIKENKINKLILLLDTSTSSFKDKKHIIDYTKYFELFDFNVYIVDKENINEIDNSIIKAKESNKQSVIILKHDTKIFNYENDYLNDSYTLSEEEITKLKNNLNVRDIPYTVSNETVEYFREMIKERNTSVIEKWNKNFDQLEVYLKDNFNKIKDNNLELTKTRVNCNLDNDDLLELTKNIFDNVYQSYPLFLGYDIDYSLRNKILSIQNGISLLGIRNYSITDLSKVNEIIPSIKTSLKLNLANIYVINEDQENSDNILLLRNIPNLDVYRPNDANELLGIIKLVLANSNMPACIIIGNKKSSIKTITSINDVKKGAYILKKEDKNISCIILSNGNDLDIAINASNILTEKGYDIRIVSIPSIELFKKQSSNYQEEILPLGIKVFVIENSTSYSWYQFVYNDKYLITSDKVNWYKDKESKEEFTNMVATKIENLIK